MNPITFLLKTILKTIQQILSLLKAGNIDEATSKLEEVEKDIEKYL